jgi:DNA polymerase-3 subunit delta
MRPEDLDRAVDKGEVAPLYFIFGEEEYLVECAVQRLVEKIVSPDFRDFNFTVFYGKEVRSEQILDAAMTLPMFAQRRVILVKRGDELSADVLDQLVTYLQNPSPESCLVFQAGKIDQRRKFFQELKKADLLVEFKKLKDDHLAPFIRREAEQRGKRIESAAAEMLVYYVGNNLRELVAQIEKLVAYCGERPAVTLDDVRAMVSDTKIDSVFELADALGRRNLDKAMRQLQTVLRDSDAPYMLIGALARHFRQLCVIRGLLQKKLPADEIGRQAKINPYFLKGLIEQARNFTPDDFVGIFSRLHEVDVLLKSGGRQQALLEMLVFAVCGIR